MHLIELILSKLIEFDRNVSIKKLIRLLALQILRNHAN